MGKICRQCRQEFKITGDDLKFYDKISPVFGGKKYQVPPPTLCPDCRQQRRLAQINQVHLFRRKCTATGENIISNYPEESPYGIYSQRYWFSDAYDGVVQGRDFDFSRSFFDQFQELSAVVPRPALFSDFLHDENSAYTNYAGKNKNCYLLFDSDENRDSAYSYGMNSSRDSLDCYRVQKLDHCYETGDSNNCYGCVHTYNSENCSECTFINNCIGCSNLIMCSNLRNKKYCVENKAVTREEYERIRKNLSYTGVFQEKIHEFQKFRQKFPHKYMREVQCENCSGNYLVNCKDTRDSYDSMNVWNGRYCTQMFMHSQDVMDTDELGECELAYEANNCGYNAYNLLCSLQCMENITDLSYCNLCFHSSSLFGCIGLRYKKYCILNKEYTKETYEELVPKIIAHMTKTGEWGEYFPITSAAFPYNLSMAQDFYPLSQAEVVRRGWNWKEEEAPDFSGVTKKIPANKLPATITEIPDDILNWAIECSESKKPFRIQKTELDFYRKLDLPIPRFHPEVRHQKRIALRNPRRLWQRNCANCQKEIQTTYAPERPEVVYCEECYLKTVY